MIITGRSIIVQKSISRFYDHVFLAVIFWLMKEYIYIGWLNTLSNILFFVWIFVAGFCFYLMLLTKLADIFWPLPIPDWMPKAFYLAAGTGVIILKISMILNSSNLFFFSSLGFIILMMSIGICLEIQRSLHEPYYCK